MANKSEIIKLANESRCEFVEYFRLYDGNIESFIENEKSIEAAFWITHANSDLSEPLPKEKIKSIFNKALDWVQNKK